jgi:hypothetical protein
MAFLLYSHTTAVFGRFRHYPCAESSETADARLRLRHLAP